MALILVHASQASPIAGWLRAAGFILTTEEAAAAAVVFTPDRASLGPGALPRLAWLPVELAPAGGWMAAPTASAWMAERRQGSTGSRAPWGSARRSQHPVYNTATDGTKKLLNPMVSKKSFGLSTTA
jgi:hypothetical protein